jgi:hypothetical protein
LISISSGTAKSPVQNKQALSALRGSYLKCARQESVKKLSCPADWYGGAMAGCDKVVAGGLISNSTGNVSGLPHEIKIFIPTSGFILVVHIF